MQSFVYQVVVLNGTADVRRGGQTHLICAQRQSDQCAEAFDLRAKQLPPLKPHCPRYFMFSQQTRITCFIGTAICFTETLRAGPFEVHYRDPPLQKIT